MSCRAASICVLVAGLATGLAACSAPLPPTGGLATPDTSATGGGLRPDVPEPTAATAAFLDARAVGSDASGRLYVVDAGALHVVVFGPDGRAEAVMGGPGTADESFVEPVDVEPTNGFAVYVADAGTGRVVRFTAERRAAEAVPIPDGATAGETLAATRDTAARGRPVGVASGPGGILYVAEARRGIVLALSPSRRIERTVGGPEAGAAALRAPTALATDGRGRLYVVDAGVVRLFDAFGSPSGTLAADGIGVARGLAVAGALVLVAGETGVGVFRDGALVQIIPSPEPLLDVTVASGTLWGLARRRLVALGPAPR